MVRAATAKAAAAVRGWPLVGAGTAIASYMILIDTVAVFWSVVALTRAEVDIRAWAAAALLAVVAIAFEEGSRRAARLQIRLSSQLHTDMTSVWAIAAAVALPPYLAVLLLGTVFAHVWFRHQRPAGEPLYRKFFVACTVLLGCLAAGVAYRSFASGSDSLPWALTGLIAALAAITVCTAVNRLLVTVVLLKMGLRGRALLGSSHDNLIEVATLCLGGMVALAVLYEPWLVLLVIAPMVTLQRGALVHELEAAATVDAKTGLLNAVAWEHLAERELARAARVQATVGVLIIDIDRFKAVNDRYGHLIGDAVLRGIGRCLAAEVREYDTVARFGGEEFVAVLPAASDADALVIAERLRSRVSQLRVSGLVDTVEPADDDWLAVSIGVSCTPTDGGELTELLHAADGALYRAKRAGRNRVMLADRGTGPDRVPQA